MSNKTKWLLEWAAAVLIVVAVVVGASAALKAKRTQPLVVSAMRLKIEK